VRLAAELGLEPGPALKTLQAQILDQAPALQPAGDSGPGPMRHVWLRRVPAPATATIGRERELNEVIALLRVPAVRLVTLTGPGGVGKTRLALVVAHALKHSFEQGVVWVELAGISRPDDVGSAIVRALEVQPAPGESTTDTLLRYLADKKLLLVVDNFEHVLDSVGLIGVLVTNCPELTVLATSREALGIAAEHRYEVAPMPLPPLPSEADVAEVEATAGTALFLAAARRHQHAFAVDSACAPLVARICGRLDGLPLALELAAARLSVLTLSELDARLTDAVTGIGSAPRDAPERQRTLRATIAWSYRLLDEEEQRAFLRFAVFAGGATVSAAQQVCGASLETLEALQAKSLLRLREQPDGSGRLMMLETLRQFALDEGADREDIGKIRRRHCAWYLRLVDECGARLDTPDEPEAVDALDRDIDNIRSALGWALADDPGQAVKLAGLLGDYWRVHNDPGGLPWIEAATAVAGDRVPPTDRARLRLVHSFQLSPMRQQWQAAIGAATEALELYRESGDDAGTATAYRALALLRVHVGQYSEARADATAACTHASAAGDTALYARSLSTLAILLPSSERPAVVDRAARLLSEAGDHREVAALYSNIGYSALVEEGPEQALDLFNNALKAAEKLRPSASTKMLVLSNIGLAQLRLGNLKDARRTFLDALKLCTTEAFRWGGHESLAGLAAVRVVEGDPEQGAQLYGAAQAAGYPPTDPYDEEMLELLERDYFDAARTRLGPARWTELTRAGAELTFDQAVRFALTAAAPLEHGSDAAEHRATVTADR
jgi:predicted ATPase